MTYIPGSIAFAFGVYELIRAIFASNKQDRVNRLGRAAIDFAIGIGLIYLNVTLMNRPT